MPTVVAGVRRSRRRTDALDPRPPPLLLGLSSVVAGASLVPVAYLGIRVTEAGWATVGDTVFSATTRDLLARSLGLAGAVSAASAVLGVALAWLTVRCDLPGRRFWKVAAALPLAIPSYVAAFAYVGAFPDLHGFGAAWVVLTLISYPYVFLPVAAALDSIDPALEETARSLGDGPRRAFLRVTIRQLRPAAATGSLLVALYVLSDFGAVSILRFDSFTRIIYQSYQASFDRTPAVVLGCLLLVFTCAIVALEARTRGRARYHTGRGAHRRPPTVRLGRARWPAVALPAAVAAVALGVPALTLLRWSLEAASLDLDLAEVRHAAFGSLSASLLGAGVTAVAALPIALVAARHRTRTAAAIERSVYLAHALPGIVVALSLVFLSVRLGPLYQRLPVLVFAYFVLFLPLAVSAVYSTAVHAP
ncbi:MAG: iron ABC transporter permease, partial [Acidimicrobiales bacterium]